MNDARISNLSTQFRTAIENARDNNAFNDTFFDRFPRNCCGDSSYLLAEFLLSKGYDSIYICGEDCTTQTHAWLVIKDNRIQIPKTEYLTLPEDINRVMNLYSNGAYTNPVNITHYQPNDIIDGLIVDITADQFGESSVYVGYSYDFYQRFECQSASDYTGLESDRLKEIYRKILCYLN